MTIRCPGCDRLLEIPGREETGSEGGFLQTLTSVSCPNCGLVSIDLNQDQTVTFLQSSESRKNSLVGHFTLVRVLGQGSFGEVWLANDVNLGREVALKLPHSQGRELTSLMYEAKTAASLRHPNIVAVYEVSADAGQVFIASEFIDGLTLRDLLTAGKLSIERAIELLTAIARALHYAHEHGVVHRDVKPANILLNKDGQAFVTDFGIAKRIRADATISSDGQVIGTARYMSPEQASGKTRETDHRSDIYALGVLLFEMLTREVPFRGNMRAILHQKIFEDAPSPRTLDPALPRDLETICLKCLEREPEKRFASALELAEELERYTAGEPIRSRPISRLERTWRWCRRRPAIAGLLSGLFLSLTFGLLGVTFFWRQAENSAVSARTAQGHAERSAKAADESRHQAERSAAAARESLYRSWMNLAAVHLGHGDTAGVKEMLARVSADKDMAHLRGFEWNYYDTVTAPLALIANPGDIVRDVAVSHDGDICASIGREQEIRVWDARTGEFVRTLQAETERFDSIDFSPTSLDLAAGSVDGYVRLWRPLKDARIVQEILHGPPVVLVRFSPDGTRLMSVGKRGAVRLWSVDDGKVLAEITTGKKADVKEVRFAEGGKTLLVATDDGHIRIWDVAQAIELKQPTTADAEFDTLPTLESMAVSDDGQLLATGNYRGMLAVRSLRDGPKFTRMTVWGRIDDIEFLAGTHFAAIACSDGQTHLLDVDSNREIRSVNTHSLTFGSLARSANGKFLVIGSGDGSISRLNLDGLIKPAIFWQDEAVRDVEFLPDGKHLVAAYEKGRAKIWDLMTGQSQSLTSHSSGFTRTISVQPQGGLIAAAGNGRNVEVLDVDSRKMVRELPTPTNGAVAVQFSPSGRQLAVATRAGPIHFYETDRWTIAWQLPGRESKVNAIAFSSDDRNLAIAWDDGRVDLVSADSGLPSSSTIVLKVEPWSLAFCDDGRLLAIGTNPGEIHLWDLAAGRARNVIKGHTGRINALAALPGGKTLVSGGRDRHLKLWDIQSGEFITPLTGHLRQVFAIAVSPDGQTIASGGLEGDIRLWPAIRKK